MRSLIEAFPTHILEALEIGRNAKLTKKSGIRNILATGLGGSGIGGKIASQIVGDSCSFPFIANNEYSIPNWADENTLVIVSSYSGGTEETLEALELALARKCQIVCVTSGGKVQEIAEANELDTIFIPGGNPPRSMLAYSLIQQLFILDFNGLWAGNFEKDLENIAAQLTESQETICNKALALAEKFESRLPIIYAETRLEGVAVRWRQQINENGKKLCWHGIIPEMNHNELIGWETANNNLGVLILSDGLEYQRNAVRTEICRGIFAKKVDLVETIQAEGETRLERMFYLIHFGDWFSYHLAILGSQDPVSIVNIDLLKSELAKL